MYRNVYFQGIQRRPVNQQQNNDYVETPIARPHYPQFKEISPAVNSALCAYASPIIRKPYEKMNMKQCIETLNRQGKINGVDYFISEFPDDNAVEICITNKSGKPAKSLLFSINDLEHVEHCINYQYKNGKEVSCHTYNYDKGIDYYCDTYYNDENPQEQFTKEGITAYTRPGEYIDYLERNKIRYKTEKQRYGDGRETFGITEYDRRNRVAQFTGFELSGENRVMREVYERDGSHKRLEFDEDATYITSYND